MWWKERRVDIKVEQEETGEMTSRHACKVEKTRKIARVTKIIAPAFKDCEAKVADFPAFARAPEKLATADGAKNFTFPVSGLDLNVFSRVSNGRTVEFVIWGDTAGDGTEDGAPEELSTAIFFAMG